jgi:transitional endoplasmic reticulum ATPase
MKNGEEGGGIGENILSQMLTEMEEGTTSRVVIIGITNRPDLIDNSMLRTGRLDLNVFVSPPDEKGRLEIIKILTDGMPLSKDVDLHEISVATQSYSGADLASLCREAAVEAMQNNSKEISSKDFAAGLKKIRPSITKEVESWYEKIKEGASSIIPREADKTFYG